MCLLIICDFSCRVIMTSPPLRSGCEIINLNVGGKTQSVLLENPRGKSLNVTDALKNLPKGKNLKLYEDSSKKKTVQVDTQGM